MTRHFAIRILVASAGFATVGLPALAQDNPWNEGPGDIVITRHVPRQNAALVGEPGQPTLVNPRTSIAGSTAFSVGAAIFTQPLSDLQAEAVRATRSPETDSLADAVGALKSDDRGQAAFAGSQAAGHERTGVLGGAVSGAMGGAGRQIQGVLSSALGRGRL